MQRLVSLVLVLAAIVVSSGTASAQLKACQDDKIDREKRITACNQVIGDTKQSVDDRAEALSTRGSLRDDAGRHDEAIADFTEALKLVPNDPAVLILRGNSYDSKGDKQRAIADYSESIKHNPGDAAAYYNRGSVYQELGDKDKALTDYKKALEIDPDFDSAKEGLAELTKK